MREPMSLLGIVYLFLPVQLHDGDFVDALTLAVAVLVLFVAAPIFAQRLPLLWNAVLQTHQTYR